MRPAAAMLAAAAARASANLVTKSRPPAARRRERTGRARPRGRRGCGRARRASCWTPSLCGADHSDAGDVLDRLGLGRRAAGTGYRPTPVLLADLAPIRRPVLLARRGTCVLAGLNMRSHLPRRAEPYRRAPSPATGFTLRPPGAENPEATTHNLLRPPRALGRALCHLSRRLGRPAVVPMLVFFAWIIFFWLLFIVFGDLFRRHDVNRMREEPGGKHGLRHPAALPSASSVYLIANGKVQAPDNVAATCRRRSRRRTTTSGPSASSSAEQIAKAKGLLDGGPFSQAKFPALKARAARDKLAQQLLRSDRPPPAGGRCRTLRELNEKHGAGIRTRAAAVEAV